MKFSPAILATALCLAACSPASDDKAAPQADAEAVPAADAPAGAPAPDAGATTPSGDPAFAAVYPGSDLTAPVTRADGDAGPGGMATFTTTATPDAVVEFYKHRAEGAGLVSTSAMNQGEARGYKAASNDGAASVAVIAAPEGERTSVQLTWSAAR